MERWVCGSCGGNNPGGTRFCGHCGAAAPSASEAAPEQAGDDRRIAEALRSFVAGPVAEKLVEAGGAIPEERRLITALFADVSGFTSLADRLDPEQLLEVIDPVISRLSSVVGRYGGYVEKFAGDALMALFGAPVSHGDDPSRALRTALEMHRELAELVKELPHDAELTLHIGVNTGHGIARILGSEARMDYAVLGDSVILAQRLEAAAPRGDTYVSEGTVRLTESEFDFEPVGELTLKGKAEPVPAWRLLGERARAADVTRRPLIGREPELAVIDAALADLDADRGGVLVITGEPGIGKSRLAAETIARAATIGASVLHASCISYGAGVAYWPYLDLLRRATGLRTDEPPDETLARLQTALEEANVSEALPFFARLLGLPGVGDGVSLLEPEAFRRGLHESFRTWVGRRAAAAPVLLIIEDVHWADASTLELTRELVLLAQTAPVLLLLAGRPEVSAQVGSIVSETECRLLDVSPLDTYGISRLADALLGGSPPETLVAFVERRTSGNPFFVQELIRTLRDGGALVSAEGGWCIRPGWDERQLPPTIEGVLAARIDLLAREAAALLQIASVIGRRMRVQLLERVAEDERLETNLDELVRAGFLDRTQENAEPVVVFHHALLQDAAYSRLLRRHRRELHLRVAEVAEELYGSGDHVIDLLARHLYLAESPKAPSYLVRAGGRAKELYANEEAILHLTRAAELEPDDVEIRLALADLHDLVGSYDDALALYDAVRKASDDVRAWRGTAGVLRKRGDYEVALNVVDDAFSTSALAEADLAPIWLEAGWSLSLLGRLDQARDVLGAALEAVDGGRTDAVVGQLLLELARTEALEGRFDSALEHGRQALDIFETGGTARGLATALRVVGGIYKDLGRLDDAASSLRRGLELAEKVGAVEEIGGCLINLGRVEEDRGEIADGIACDRRAIEEFERIGHGAGRARGYANLAHKLALAGEYDEALSWAERAIEFSRQIGHLATVADAIDTTAAVQLERRRFREAAERAEEAAALYVEMGSAPYAADSLNLAARAWRSAGDAERARAVEERAREVSAPDAGLAEVPGGAAAVQADAH
jgi:adenylate cyclase